MPSQSILCHYLPIPLSSVSNTCTNALVKPSAKNTIEEIAKYHSSSVALGTRPSGFVILTFLNWCFTYVFVVRIVSAAQRQKGLL